MRRVELGDGRRPPRPMCRGPSTDLLRVPVGGDHNEIAVCRRWRMRRGATPVATVAGCEYRRRHVENLTGSPSGDWMRRSSSFLPARSRESITQRNRGDVSGRRLGCGWSEELVAVRSTRVSVTRIRWLATSTRPTRNVSISPSRRPPYPPSRNEGAVPQVDLRQRGYGPLWPSSTASRFAQFSAA